MEGYVFTKSSQAYLQG